ncbi:MAG: PTS glucitol/sorbitol transporter subunit IIA [Vagococcus sp.]|uniref:PTS glucitol/sorbitol transporter subunit IIA n=1 Tax=Vagococcus sp. TaxID=1933889 RepID=UPI002FC5EB39
MMQSIVMSIGEEAINSQEPLLILFNETATEELRKFSIIQRFKTKELKEISVGDYVSFDEQKYKVTKVGPLANKNLEEMGHVSMVFKEVDKEHSLDNALYLEPHVLPNITEETIVTYH